VSTADTAVAVIVNQLRKNFYLDSVALMRFSRSIAAMPGVEEAALMMGTPANLQIMADAGLLNRTGENAAGGDLILAIRAETEASAEQALAESQALLDQPAAAVANAATWRPRTLRTALKHMPEANLALISVPGDFAISEARKAIRRGLHAMIFSDNVSLAAEAALKHEAQALGRLVMGPDCGTAIINGTPLAFANSVARGVVGIIGASGTGIQEVSSLIGQYGGGISHAIGVGGRDLRSEIGGISTLMALDALATDAATAHIVLISKPPPADVMARVLKRVAGMRKPVTVCFIGAEGMPMPENATQVFSLKDAARTALSLRENDHTTRQSIPSNIRSPSLQMAGQNTVRGLFSGGTLCAEAQSVLLAAEAPVASNAPIPGAGSVSATTSGHQLLDLGDDRYTRGRPHPMIDPLVRDELIIDAIGDSTVAVILLDVVIGFGAHHDPAGHVADLVMAHQRQDGPVVIASVTGTETDPQTRSLQIAKLEAASIHVAPTNADAAVWSLLVTRSIVSS
jgi:FdrA protein